MLIKVFEKAGKDLTTDSFLKALESIKGYRDIFGGPVVSFGPDRHHGTDEVLFFQVQKGRFVQIAGPFTHRSEEHTSELQSLMRISYAVFCLNKKHQKRIITHTTIYYKIIL